MVDHAVSYITVTILLCLYILYLCMPNCRRRVLLTDRFVLHDQPMSGRHRDAVLRDEEARDGADVGRAAALQLQRDPGQRRTSGQLLRRDPPLRGAPRPRRSTSNAGPLAAVRRTTTTTQAAAAAATAADRGKRRQRRRRRNGDDGSQCGR